MYNRNSSLLLRQQKPKNQGVNMHLQLRQTGFSLVELMVGLAIGLLVVLAAIGSLVFTQLTSSVVDDSSRLQQKADAVFRNIGYHIAQAGAIELDVSAADLAKVAFSTLYKGYNASTFNIQGSEGAKSTDSDTLSVSYQSIVNPAAASAPTAAASAPAPSRDCLGSTLSGANVDNKFYVTGTNLMCLGAGNPSSPQSIADGVEDFQVVYGVQTNLKYQFFTATAVPDWSKVKAVQVCIQLKGDNKGNPQPGLVLKDCRGETLTNDGYLRRIYQRTFSMRNALL